MPSFDVVTVGAATQDFFLQSQKFEERRDPYAPDGFDACVPLGAKIELQTLTEASGGGATNVAITMARFGLGTACLCRVGEDEAGTNLVQELESEQIYTDLIQHDPINQTARSFIILSGSGSRAILTHRGAAQHLETKAIPWKSISTGWLYITSVGGNLEFLRELFRFAKRERSQIAWNPGQQELSYGAKNLASFLKQTAVLILNREEGALLCNLPLRHSESILSNLRRKPTHALVLTDGARGAWVADRETVLKADAIPGKRVNTTGAGDAFGSAFVASLILGHDLKTCLQDALLNSFSVVTHMGAKAGILKCQPTPAQRKKIASLIKRDE